MANGNGDKGLTEDQRLLIAANRARAAGVDPGVVDRDLKQRIGVGFSGLLERVRTTRFEPERTSEVTTKDILRAQAYGATLGWLDEIEGIIGAAKSLGREETIGEGFQRARSNALQEIRRFEKEHPALAQGAKAFGAGAGVLATLAGASAAGVLQAGVPTVAGISPALAAGGGAGAGGIAGAGGLLGESVGVEDRARGAVGGALVGGALGAGSTLIPRAAGVGGGLLRNRMVQAGAGGGLGALLLNEVLRRRRQ